MAHVVVVSGYFNPLHVGHVRMIREARSLGDRLIVVVNNDEQQRLKKGKIISPIHDRVEVVSALADVDEVFTAVDLDPTICETLRIIRRRYPQDKISFCNGGDRSDMAVVPEGAVCHEEKIGLLFGIGGTDKADSSSRINSEIGAE